MFYLDRLVSAVLREKGGMLSRIVSFTLNPVVLKGAKKKEREK